MGAKSMAWKKAIRWAKSERGNVAILFGLMLPLVVGGAAYGVETTYWYLTRLQMQSAADAAAIAGAMDARSGFAYSTIQTSATKAATDNGYVVGGSNVITVNNPATTGTAGPNSVEVIINTQATRFFTAVFTNTPVNVRARAVAKFQTAGSACVLALNPSASQAAKFWGSSHLTLTGCSVMSNSLSSSALAVGGSGYLSADCLIATGGVSVDSGAHYTCSAPITGAAPVADPYANVPVPTCANTYNNDNANPLQPGCYPNGISVAPNKTVSFAPGVYIIDNTFKLNNNSAVSCTGCTFYMRGNATIDWNGGANENFQAPTSGTYSGMLIMGDRTNTALQTFNGNNTSLLTGAIYFKKATIQYNGNYSGLNGCTYVVADKVDWSGNSTFNVDCTAYGMLPIPAAYTVKLWE
jgi:Flp pilus assembly protein TadG